MSQTTDVSDMEDDNVSVAPTRSVTIQQLQRSPISPGGSPSMKRTKSSPDPAPIAKEAIQWLLHTLNLEMTRETHMAMDVTRSLLVKLEALNTSVHDLLMANLELKSKLKESRFTTFPVCVKEFSLPDKMKNHMKTVHECYMPKAIDFPQVPFLLLP